MLAAIIGPLGVPELLVIFLILVLIFGASKLPQLGRGLGEGIRNFKSGIKGGDKTDELEQGQNTQDDTKP